MDNNILYTFKLYTLKLIKNTTAYFGFVPPVFLRLKAYMLLTFNFRSRVTEARIGMSKSLYYSNFFQPHLFENEGKGKL